MSCTFGARFPNVRDSAFKLPKNLSGIMNLLTSYSITVINAALFFKHKKL